MKVKRADCREMNTRMNHTITLMDSLALSHNNGMNEEPLESSVLKTVSATNNQSGNCGTASPGINLIVYFTAHGAVQL
jgi:hypothetical protein